MNNCKVMSTSLLTISHEVTILQYISIISGINFLFNNSSLIPPLFIQMPPIPYGSKRLSVRNLFLSSAIFRFLSTLRHQKWYHLDVRDLLQPLHIRAFYRYLIRKRPHRSIINLLGHLPLPIMTQIHILHRT